MQVFFKIYIIHADQHMIVMSERTRSFHGLKFLSELKLCFRIFVVSEHGNDTASINL